MNKQLLFALFVSSLLLCLQVVRAEEEFEDDAGEAFDDDQVLERERRDVTADLEGAESGIAGGAGGGLIGYKGGKTGGAAAGFKAGYAFGAKGVKGGFVGAAPQVYFNPEDIFDEIISLQSQIATITGEKLHNQLRVFNEFKRHSEFAVKPFSEILETQVVSVLEATKFVQFKRSVGRANIQQLPLLQKLESKIRDLKLEVSNFVVQKNQVTKINNPLIFESTINISVKCPQPPCQMLAKSFQPKLLDDIIYHTKYTKVNTIHSPVYFDTNAKINGSLSIGRINGLDFNQNIASRSARRVTIRSPLKIGSIQSDLITTKVLQRVDFNNLIFINDKRPLTISSPINFNSLSFMNNISEFSNISNVNFRIFASSALTYNSTQIIVKPFNIKSIQAPAITLHGNLNGIDFNKRITRLLRADRSIKVPSLTINSRFMKADQFALRNLNNFNFPGDFLLQNSTQIISSPVFLNHLVLGRVNVQGLINGLRYPDSFVTLDRNETLNSNIHFIDPVIMNRSVLVTGYFGRHHIQNLKSWVHTHERTLRDNPSGNVILNGNIIVNGKINGLQFDLILPDLVHSSERFVQVSGSKTFENEMFVRDFKSNDINTILFKNFVSKLNPTIASPLKFTKPLEFINLNSNQTATRGSILDLIQKKTGLSQNSSIFGEIYLDDMVIYSLQLDSKQTINSLSPLDLVFNFKQQTIKGIKIFTEVTFKKPIEATDIVMNQSLNNKNINSIVIKKKKEKEIFYDELILSNSNVSQLKFSVSNNQGQSIVNLLRNILLQDGNQTIRSRVKFLYPVSFVSRISSRSLQGALNGLHSQLILDHFNAGSLTILGDLKVEGKVNNIDLPISLIDLQKQTTKYYTITESQSFFNGFTAKKFTFKYLNGEPFEKFLQRKMRPNFTTFARVAHLYVHKNVHINGSLNGKSMDVLHKIKNNQISRRAIIHGNVVFNDNVQIARNLKFSGTINNVSFDWLFKDLATTDKEIIGIKTFKQLTIEKNLSVRIFNRVLLNPLLQNIVLVHPHHEKIFTLITPIEFTNYIQVEKNIDQSRVQTRFYQNINNVNVDGLLRSVNQKFGDRKDSLVFFDPVEIKSSYPITITGNVNGINLIRDAVWLNNTFHRYQVINGFKSFSRATFESKIDIQDTFNGVKLKNRLGNLIDLRNPQTILNHIKLDGKVILLSNFSVYQIGKNYASSLVEIKGPKDRVVEVNRKWIFYGPVEIRKDLIVHERIKNDSSLYLMRKGIDQILEMPILNEMFFKRTEHLISENTKFQHPYWNQTVAQKLSDLDRKIENNRVIRQNLNGYLQSIPIKIKGFRVVQRFPNVLGQTIVQHSSDEFSIGQLVGENVIFRHLYFNKSKWMVGKETTTSYINNFEFKLDKRSYNLYQASPNSSKLSILTNDKQIIGHLGSAYDDLKILSLNKNAKFISALSSIRGVVETFAFGIFNGQPDFSLISKLNVSINSRKISLFSIGTEIYLTVTRSSDKGCESEDNPSLLFLWLREEKYFKLVQKFTHFEASNVVHYTFNEQNYLAFSENKEKFHRLTEKAIHVYKGIFYKWPNCQFDHFQSIDFEAATDLQSFTVPSSPWSVQLLAALNSSKLMIWQQKGSAGFTRIWLETLNEGQAFKFFIMNQKLHVIVAQLSRMGSFILEAII